eukprot:TRINITY_DN5523_c0_g1_i1.p1 TRINITY_DN5523_c0_g1~~TRINITY_DN5523_c0_g1_i1.p1  ORF type:complete len:374 (-),score=67.34 TRINITY_DN5523_c0_g1_i1:17-1138(-)
MIDWWNSLGVPEGTSRTPFLDSVSEHAFHTTVYTPHGNFVPRVPFQSEQRGRLSGIRVPENLQDPTRSPVRISGSNSNLNIRTPVGITSTPPTRGDQQIRPIPVSPPPFRVDKTTTNPISSPPSTRADESVDPRNTLKDISDNPYGEDIKTDLPDIMIPSPIKKKKSSTPTKQEAEYVMRKRTPLRDKTPPKQDDLEDLTKKIDNISLQTSPYTINPDSPLANKEAREKLWRLPSVQNDQYFTDPPLEELENYSLEELGKVKDFTIGRQEIGFIKFEGETDVRGLRINDLVVFENHSVVVYPDSSQKPPVGQGLNKRAIIGLFNCYPEDESGNIITDEDTLETFIEQLKNMGNQFLQYDLDSGCWIFQVENFD